MHTVFLFHGHKHFMHCFYCKHCIWPWHLRTTGNHPIDMQYACFVAKFTTFSTDRSVEVDIISCNYTTCTTFRWSRNQPLHLIIFNHFGNACQQSQFLSNKYSVRDIVGFFFLLISQKIHVHVNSWLLHVRNPVKLFYVHAHYLHACCACTLTPILHLLIQYKFNSIYVDV